MRGFEEASKSWQHFLTFPTLSDLKLAIRVADKSSKPLVGSRSLCWKAFLLFEDSSRSEWLRRISDARSAYASVRAHLLKALEHPEEIGSGFDPLSDGTESPWAALREDETLRAEILQDVDRCMPENVYFRQPGTQKMLLDILFVFCKLNPDVSYRQGMHELLAPILWVVERDALESKPTGKMLSQDDEMLCQLCDRSFIEHDTFTLFGIVMQGAKSFYEPAAHNGPSQVSTAKSAATLENPLLTRIHRIFDEYLPHIDPLLAQHLREIDLIPQVFLMKWIRLLYGREFSFDDVLCMWDVIFAEDPTLEIVDFVCLVMIVRLHWDLIHSDYNTALTLLLRYPALSDSMAPQTLVVDALYLRDHPHQSGASHIIKKHSGRPLATVPVDNEAILPTQTPAASMQSMLGSRLQAVGLSPRSPGIQSTNLDRVFQDAAKGLFKRGEQWGINKAVRDAIVEVQKGVREIQNTPTPQRPRTYSRTASRQNGPSPAVKLAAQEARNASLAKMLKSATDDLWRYHEEAVAGKGIEKESLDALSVAIARVQFTQVYLEDSTVPLPTEETEPNEDAVDPSTSSETKPGPDSENHNKADHDNAEPKAPASSTTGPPPPPSKSRPKKSTTKPSPADIPRDFQTPRPSLTQSSFSWMLGQDSSPSSFVQAQPLPPSDARRRSKGFLFGNDTDAPTAADGEAGGAKSAGGGRFSGTNKLRKKKPEQNAHTEVLFEQDTEVWDLGKLEEEKRQQQVKEKGTAVVAGGGEKMQGGQGEM